MRYYTHVGKWYAAKNKYCASIQEYLQTIDSKIVKDVSLFSDTIKEDLRRIRKDYPRHKAAQLEWFTAMDTDIIQLFFSPDIAYVYLYPIKEEEAEND